MCTHHASFVCYVVFLCFCLVVCGILRMFASLFACSFFCLLVCLLVCLLACLLAARQGTDSGQLTLHSPKLCSAANFGCSFWQSRSAFRSFSMCFSCMSGLQDFSKRFPFPASFCNFLWLKAAELPSSIRQVPGVSWSLWLSAKPGTALLRARSPNASLAFGEGNEGNGHDEQPHQQPAASTQQPLQEQISLRIPLLCRISPH